MALGDYALTPCGLLFHPHTSLWGKELPVRASAPRRGWGRREVKRHPNRSPFSRSVWLSLSITAVFVSFYREQLLAAGDRRRDEKAIFIKQNYPSKRVRWMWLAWSRSGPPGRSEERWRSMPLIGSMGWLKAQKRGERGDRSHHQLWWGVWGWGGCLGKRVSVFSSRPWSLVTHMARPRQTQPVKAQRCRSWAIKSSYAVGRHHEASSPAKGAMQTIYTSGGGGG